MYLRAAINGLQTASPKGLVAGLREIDEQATVVHASWDGTAFDGLADLSWILVVEKEVRIT